MADALVHRGPDAEGIWIDDRRQVGLAYRRLAVLDPSSAGAQPFASPSGRYILIYNGELYNHLDLRRRLAEEGAVSGWRGRSDTETLAAAIDGWGLVRTLQSIEGMFAFACWDRERGRLVLARDRLCEKPIYFGWVGEGASAEFLFGSELKAFRAHPCFSPRIDRQALARFMRHGHVPGPQSIYREVRKLPPGCTATLDVGQSEPAIQAYWSVESQLSSRNVCGEDLNGGPSDERLEALLRSVVRHEMAADVPVGAFLSGGVDSSTVVALMQQESPERVKTFSLGFEETHFNEAPEAKAVARHLGTDHRELIISAADASAVIPTLPAVYDEPFADPSAIPTLLLSQFARERVTVALSGDGADELFGGYNVYFLASSLARLLKVPRGPRSALGTILGRLAAPRRTSNRVLRHFLDNRLAHKIDRGADLLKSETPGDLYAGLTAAWRSPNELVIDSGGELGATGERQFADLEGIERMMATDLVSYLPDNILVKVDRAAMHHSLETRMPFLHPAIVAFALGEGRSRPGRGRRSKWPLRRILHKYVPPALVDRPKQGFGIPVAEWLRGPLRSWAEEMLDPDRLRREGFLRPEPVRTVWRSHLAGRNVHGRLWPILMFQTWLSENRGHA